MQLHESVARDTASYERRDESRRMYQGGEPGMQDCMQHAARAEGAHGLDMGSAKYAT
jgi:hypothetical protein